MTIFYDFNIAPNMEVINTLEKFNYKGACVFYKSKEFNENTVNHFNYLKDTSSLDLYMGIVINERNPQLIFKSVQRFKNKADFIMVNGGDAKLNRVIAQMPKVDIINHPYANKRNSGVNHIIAKLLVDNNITVNINLKDMLVNKRFYRARILNQINQVLKLQKKYGFRTILSSGSTSFYDVRSSDALKLLAKLLDVDDNLATKFISDNPVELIENYEENKNSIIKGVKLIRK